MGTVSTKKFLKQSNGAMAEEAALTTSAGAADAHRIPALNAAGVLDTSIINGKAVTAGAADAGKPILTNGSGKLDETMLPTGLGADVWPLTASEALTAGDFVNIWNDGGTAKVRKADATTEGKHAMGFVKAAVALNAQATVYFEGTNDQVTGQTPGDVYLQTTAGRGGAAAPSAAGNVIQRIGFAVSATAVNFQAGTRIILSA